MLTLRTADLPAAERFDYWMSQLSASMPAEIRTPRRDNFLATTSGEDLGTMRAIVSTYPTFKARRTPAMIRYADPECYVFVLARTGGLALLKAGKQ